MVLEWIASSRPSTRLWPPKGFQGNHFLESRLDNFLVIGPPVIGIIRSLISLHTFHRNGHQIWWDGLDSMGSDGVL